MMSPKDQFGTLADILGFSLLRRKCSGVKNEVLVKDVRFEA